MLDTLSVCCSFFFKILNFLKKKFLFIFLIHYAFSLIIFETYCYSKENPERISDNRSFLLGEGQNIYLNFGFSANSALNDSQTSTTDKNWQPLLGVCFYPNNYWQLGITGQFRKFLDKTTNRDLNLFTISQESFKRVRLYHPFYFNYGFALLYIIPTENLSFPLQKHDIYLNEYGLSLLSFSYLTSKI